MFPVDLRAELASSQSPCLTRDKSGNWDCVCRGFSAFLPSAFPVSQPDWVRWAHTWGLSPLSACLGGEIPKQAELDILWNNQVHPISMVLLWVFTLPLSALPYMQSKVLCFLSSWHLSSPTFYWELPETATLIELPSPPPSSRDAAPTIRIQLSTCPVQSSEGKERFFVSYMLFDIKTVEAMIGLSLVAMWPLTHASAHACHIHSFDALLLGRGVER